MKKCLIAVVMVLSIAACGEREPAKTIEGISSDIIRVERGGRPEKPSFKITATPQTSPFAIGGLALDIAKWLSGKHREINDLALISLTDVTDGYGNAKKGLVMQVTLKESDFRKINWDGISQYEFINLLKVDRISPIGRQAAYEYCVTSDRGKFMPDFCSRALR